MNLDTRQRGAERISGEKFSIPAIYITELMSVALGSPKTGEFFRGHCIDPGRIFERSTAV
jgi:heterodisulfide reductase subunit B